jgi:hypothetical protein
MKTGFNLLFQDKEGNKIKLKRSGNGMGSYYHTPDGKRLSPKQMEEYTFLVNLKARKELKTTTNVNGFKIKVHEKFKGESE